MQFLNYLTLFYKKNKGENTMQADQRLTRLAENILQKSLKVKKGEKVYLESFGASTKELLNEIHISYMIYSQDEIDDMELVVKSDFFVNIMNELDLKDIKEFKKNNLNFLASY